MRMINFLRSLHRDAALDSLRDVLAVVGLAALLGDFAAMRVIFIIPGVVILSLVWYADYLRHDLPPAVIYSEGDPKLLEQIAEFGQ